MKHEQAISATVTGNDQQVGFSAMVMKQAIRSSLAGTAENEQDEAVRFTLHGGAKRMNPAIAAIRKEPRNTSMSKSHRSR